MSGDPSCATTEPSRYSTMPWIMDCGCTSKEEVEKACQNMKESTNENFEILRLKCESNSSKILEAEQNRQKDALLDYENERLSVVINDSKNSVLIQIQMSTSYLRKMRVPAGPR